MKLNLGKWATIGVLSGMLGCKPAGPGPVPPELQTEITKLENEFKKRAKDYNLAEMRDVTRKRRKAIESIGCTDNSSWKTTGGGRERGASMETEITCPQNPDLTELYRPYIGRTSVSWEEELRAEEQFQLGNLKRRFHEECTSDKGLGAMFYELRASQARLERITAERSKFLAEKGLDDFGSVWVCTKFSEGRRVRTLVTEVRK